ncbi:adenylyltransferase/sulfurtransferase [Mucilaginibacter yixingensis]|uniref:Molybdopterin-synthase adenylyltransferase n=1 Tax=Mucilaginibacter yixingensis TaxID=1295612 RepID=A0A2T5J4Z3_9SPHI|nr:HesA/MoeB/ThiF family protein [Mucilaginibacter yixingensis]PTQ92694.1 adenylyltransferase/sulfurtransferase [Mucilaginibacter yixingensis]
MDANLLRYSCQMALPGFGTAAQQKLQRAKVLIVGAGGLGCPAAQYLAASGIGALGIADDDVVNISNLHRQILFNPADEGRKKAEVVTERLQQQNPQINVTPHMLRVDAVNVMELFQSYDIIVDATDNFETRYLLNDAAVLQGKPLVYGAIYQFEGQVAVWNVANADGRRTPNYRDLYPQVDASQVPDCAVGGVIPTLAGVIGCMQANEVLKYLTGTGDLLAGKILIFDAQTMQSRVVGIGKTTKTNIQSLPQPKLMETISADDLKAAMAANAVELIDIRTEEEHEEFNIGGANVEPYLIERHLKTLDGSKPVVLYCIIGKRSAAVVQKMREVYPGLKIYSLEGGINHWED